MNKLKKMSKSDIVFLFIVYATVILISVVILYPLWFVIIASISDPNLVATGEVLLLPKGVTLGLITRGNKVLKIDKDLRFEDGDHLIAFLTDHKQLRHLTKLFRPRSFWIPSW